VGSDLYAIPAATAREVVAEPTVAALPTAPPAVVGLFSLRGEIVPLFDTAQLLGLGALSAPSHAAVLRTPGGAAGLAATALPRVVELGVAVGSSELPATLGTFDVDGRLAVLLDVEALLYPAVTAGVGGVAGPAPATTTGTDRALPVVG
jgi:purine-binding chemotaxis protein CheW